MRKCCIVFCLFLILFINNVSFALSCDSEHNAQPKNNENATNLSEFNNLKSKIQAKKSGAGFFRIVDKGFVHEAFVTKENGTLLLEAISLTPPSLIHENPPRQKNKKLQWVSGYWHWSEDDQDFYWISGVWRRPPPGMLWNSGKWQHTEEGWVWLRGFWSMRDEAQLAHLSTFPPASIDEKILPPTSNEYFWIPGLWEWDKETRKYHWLSGRWDLFDQKWIYTPGHYEWREKGTIFIPGYWDWTVNQRGIAYAPVFIDSSHRDSKAQFSPDTIVPESLIMEIYFPWWPSYRGLFQYHYHYHPELWAQWNVSPPWWSSNQWWTLPADDQWALWWWWTHPGFSEPAWLTEKTASKIPPPSEFLVILMSSIRPPPFITFEGGASEATLLNTLLKVIENENVPILPTDPKERQKIYDLSSTKHITSGYLRPSGQPGTIESSASKPFFGPGLDSLECAPGKVKTVPRPVTKEEKITTEQPQETNELRHSTYRKFPGRSSFPQTKLGSVRSVRERPAGRPPAYKPPPPSGYKNYSGLEESYQKKKMKTQYSVLSEPSTVSPNRLAPPSTSSSTCSMGYSQGLHSNSMRPQKRIPQYVPPNVIPRYASPTVLPPYISPTGIPQYVSPTGMPQYAAPNGGILPQYNQSGMLYISPNAVPDQPPLYGRPTGGYVAPLTPRYAPAPVAPRLSPGAPYNRLFPYQSPSLQVQDLRRERYNGPQIRAPTIAPTTPIFHHTYQGAEHMMPWPEVPIMLQDRGDFMNHPMPQRNNILLPANDPTGLWN